MIHTERRTSHSATLASSCARGWLDAASFSSSRATRWRCSTMPASSRWSALTSAVARSPPISAGQFLHQLLRVGHQLVGREPHAEAEFGVVLEQRVAPGRAAPGAVDGVGRARQVAAVDGGAAGGVGDQHAVAEQLRREPDVGRLAAAGAGAGKLEQRVEQHGAGDGAVLERTAVELGQAQEEGEVVALLVAQRHDRRHVHRAPADVGLVVDRAGLDAVAAAGAVLRRHLVADVGAGGEFLALRRHVLEGRRCVGSGFGTEGARADRGVRADEHALAALGAEVGLPHRNFQRDVALFVLRGAERIGAVGGQQATPAGGRRGPGRSAG